MTFKTPQERITALKQGVLDKDLEHQYIALNGFKIVRNNVLYWKDEYCDIEV